jgi:hypothetical protein
VRRSGPFPAARAGVRRDRPTHDGLSQARAGEAAGQWLRSRSLCYRCRKLEGAAVIYCVVPPELGEDAYKRLVEHYRDNPNIKVIMDRRRGERRAGHDAARQTAGRRRRRMPGNFDV